MYSEEVEERAAIMEFDANIPHYTANVMAVSDVYFYKEALKEWNKKHLPSTVGPVASNGVQKEHFKPLPPAF